MPLAFIHIPKTAGTSFREAAARFYGRAHGCFDYGPYAEQTHGLARRFMLEVHDPGTFRQRFDAGSYRLFSGHVDASRYREAFAYGEMVSLVREPLQRIVSEYRHFQRYFGEQREFPAFYRDPRFINRQSRMLDGDFWAAMGFVGVSERLAESLALLNAQWGTDIEPVENNLSRTNLLEEYPIDPRQRAELERLNAADMHLYREVCIQLDWRSRLASSHQEHITGAFAPVETGGVAGWAIPGRDGAPVTVEVLLDGQPCTRLTAAEHRSDIADRGLANAAIGFSLSLPAAKRHGRLTCRVAATGQPLAAAFDARPEFCTSSE